MGTRKTLLSRPTSVRDVDRRDLHPAQLPIRYAACFSLFLEGFAWASARLSNFIDKAVQATLLGDVFDDAAIGQGIMTRPAGASSFSVER